MKKAFTSFLFVLTVALASYAQTMVAVSSNVFTPSDITIEVGETVQWDNTGGFHNVNGSQTTFPDNPEGFSNGAASSDAWTFSHTFNTAGVYNYQCDPHSSLGMTGTVTVNAAPANVDLVITEIMYNNPGVDDFEFIEIYNNGTENVNLENYTITNAFGYTFPDVTIDAGAYLVIALNADDMLNNFGVTALQWTSDNMNNTGETIEIRNPGGDLVDEVTYSDSPPFAEICDGEGPSLELCDVNADNNDPANWSFSTTNTGVVYGSGNNTVYASAGFANNSCAETPYIFFDGTSRVVNEGDGSANIRVNMANVGAMDTTDITIVVDGSSTATEGEDYTINDMEFGIGGDGVGSLTTVSFTVNLIDDAVEENTEVLNLTISMATNGAVIAGSTYEITIEDNDGLSYPAYDITTVTSNDADGLADSLDVLCQLQGIVYGVDLQGNDNIQFTIIDASGGIGLFSSNDYGYTVAEGDEVIVRGSISQFNGLTQISPDTIILVSSNNMLIDPAIVTALGEDTESELIRINGVSLVEPSEWTGDGSSFNVNITDGVNNYTMRIDNDVNLSNQPAPVGDFDVIGIGGQFDSSSPFDGGYRILPRYIPDIIPVGGTQITANDDAATTDINQAINIEVLANDITPNGIASIVADELPLNGSLTLEVDNSYTYTPDMDYCGIDEFTYIICDATTACDTATVTIDVTCPTVYPQYPIGQVTTNDQDGVPDSLGVAVEITGIVYGVDLQGNDNIQFTIIDAFNPDAGISLFSNNNFGYTVTEGDELIVQGVISQFNGLTQITPDTLWSVSSGNNLHDPEIVTGLGENTESKLVKFENMSFVNPADWDGTGDSFNIDITDGVNTISMRIDNDVDLANMNVPQFTTFNVTGIGGQFDNSSPFDEGYQLLPRYMEDIEEFVSVVDPTISEKVSMYPNPVSETLFVRMSVNMERLRISNVLGQDVINVENPDNLEEINVSDIPAGLYILTFVNGERIWSTQFVKE